MDFFNKLFGKQLVKADQSPEISVNLVTLVGDPELEILFIEQSVTDIQRALESWRWLGLNGLEVIAVSAFGDLFFRASNGSIHFLCTIEGTLTQIAGSLSEFRAQLQNSEFRDRLLLAGTVISLQDRGIILDTKDCFDFKIAPVIGGPMTIDDVHKLLFVVKVHIAGQLHDQVRNMPPGTRISRFHLEE